MVKSPFNYVGNKYKYRHEVQKLVKGKSYLAEIDLFLGSGNLLFNSGALAKHYIGVDYQRLIPNIYNKLKSQGESYGAEEFWTVIDEYNNFTTKEDYYTFRDDWNDIFKKDRYDREFVLRTVLLFKLCSNSMVRYNTKGEFNQGFRGAKPGGFFQVSTIDNIKRELNQLRKFLRNNPYSFYVANSIDYLELLPDKNCLILLDPPYVLRKKNMYAKGTYDMEAENKLLDYITSTKNDFILFNFVEREEEVHHRLETIMRDFNVINLSTTTGTGQARKGTKKVQEVIVTNIT